MKVSLNVHNDEELRSYIKDLVKGNVISIVREELLAIIQEEINRKLKGLNERRFQNLLKESTIIATENILRKDHGVMRWNTEFVKPHVVNAVERAIHGIELDKIVRQVAVERLSSLLKEEPNK